MTVDRNFDESVKQICERDTGRLPEIKRERTGDCVDLVEVKCFGIHIVQEVDPSHTTAPDRFEDFQCDFLQVAGAVARNLCRDEAVERGHAGVLFR